MDSKLTVRLPANLRRALDQASKRMNRKYGEIVRIALSQFLGVMPETTEKPIEPLRGLIGSLESRIPDLLSSTALTSSSRSRMPAEILLFFPSGGGTPIPATFVSLERARFN